MFRRRTIIEMDKIKKSRLVEKAQKHLNEQNGINSNFEMINDHYELVKCKVRGGCKDHKHL